MTNSLGTNPANWIGDGEKYALVGLSVKLEGPISTGEVAPHLVVLADLKFDIPAHWREWLGTVRAEQVDDCNLLLVSKHSSSRPEVLDDENQRLQHRVFNFYTGLVLASTFATAHAPVMLTGARRSGEVASASSPGSGSTQPDSKRRPSSDKPMPRRIIPYRAAGHTSS
jgi:hypothetical protein